MSVGTRSLLVGVHQVLWHPITVWRAWCKLYGRPWWREVVCFFLHDLGYLGRRDMDGPDGVRHPELGAAIAGWLFGPRYRDLVLYHSRTYARMAGVEPSPLCWADKASIAFEPRWWYLLRARMSGEIREYRREAARAGVVRHDASDEQWFEVLASLFRSLGEGRGETGPVHRRSA